MTERSDKDEREYFIMAFNLGRNIQMDYSQLDDLIKNANHIRDEVADTSRQNLTAILRKLETNRRQIYRNRAIILSTIQELDKRDRKWVRSREIFADVKEKYDEYLEAYDGVWDQLKGKFNLDEEGFVAYLKIERKIIQRGLDVQQHKPTITEITEDVISKDKKGLLSYLCFWK